MSGGKTRNLPRLWATRSRVLCRVGSTKLRGGPDKIVDVRGVEDGVRLTAVSSTA